MDISGDEFVEKFMEAHPEFLIELKLAAFMAYLDDSDIWNGKDDLKKDTVAFCDVFRKHKVDPEVSSTLRKKRLSRMIFPVRNLLTS